MREENYIAASRGALGGAFPRSVQDFKVYTLRAPLVMYIFEATVRFGANSYNTEEKEEISS